MIRCGSYRLGRLEREALRRVFARSEFELIFHATDAVELSARITDTAHDLVLVNAQELATDGPAKLYLRRSNAIIAIAQTNTVESSYAAMSAGAVATVILPTVSDAGQLEGGPEFLEKFRRAVRLSNIAARTTPPRTASLEAIKIPHNSDQRSYLLIGASTGGPNAIAAILRALPVDARLVVLIVQHMEADFLDGFATWLATQTTWPVAMAQVNERAMPGRACVAPANKHLVLDADGHLLSKMSSAHELHVPSVNRLFASGAKLPARGVAVLLTGMGDDGALGMAELKAAGWRTIAQDQSTSSVFGMPRAAAKLGVVDVALPIQNIAAEITRSLQILRKKP
jgi:two-component system, chemotaxis family, response regulator WspF